MHMSGDDEIIPPCETLTRLLLLNSNQLLLYTLLFLLLIISKTLYYYALLPSYIIVWYIHNRLDFFVHLSYTMYIFYI